LDSLISLAFLIHKGHTEKGGHRWSISSLRWREDCSSFVIPSHDRLTDVAGRRERPKRAAPFPIHIDVSAHNEATRAPSLVVLFKSHSLVSNYWCLCRRKTPSPSPPSSIGSLFRCILKQLPERAWAPRLTRASAYRCRPELGPSASMFQNKVPMGAGSGRGGP
jgi:hypothetical protein